MRFKSKVRGANKNIYFSADLVQRLNSLVEQGAYASEIVNVCVRAHLPEIEKQFEAEKRTTAKRSANK